MEGKEKEVEEERKFPNNGIVREDGNLESSSVQSGGVWFSNILYIQTCIHRNVIETY